MVIYQAIYLGKEDFVIVMSIQVILKQELVMMLMWNGTDLKE